MIDRSSLTIVTVTLKSPEIEQHQAKFQVGSILCIENICVLLKSKKSFEKGHMLIEIKVESTIVIDVVKGRDNEFVENFYHIDSIGEFQK